MWVSVHKESMLEGADPHTIIGKGVGQNLPEVSVVVGLLRHQRRVCTARLGTEVTRRLNSSGERRGRANSRG